MYCPIIELSEKTQDMPNTKASNGGQKFTVKLVCQRNGNWSNRAEIRIVFHHDMVYITEIRYTERFVRDDRFHGHYEKSNFSKPIKNAYPFYTHIHGCTHDGHDLDSIAMADLALKMYRNQYIYTNPDGKKYLMDI